MPNHQITLPAHALARLNSHPGEELLVVLPVDPPQPMRAANIRPHIARCPYAPGDVLVVERPQPDPASGKTTGEWTRQHHLPITRVECKRALTRGEWESAGFQSDINTDADDYAYLWWRKTYVDSPEFAWEKVWVWCVWVCKGGE